MRTTAENSQIQTIHNFWLKILYPTLTLFLYKEMQPGFIFVFNSFIVILIDFF